MNFRAHVSAAQLKHDRKKQQEVIDANFRAHVSAAQLKRILENVLLSPPWSFPRSRERGPIEANKVSNSYFQLFSHFRAHVSAAQLKQLPMSRDLANWTNFRAHVSAAQLKRCRSVECRGW